MKIKYCIGQLEEAKKKIHRVSGSCQNVRPRLNYKSETYEVNILSTLLSVCYRPQKNGANFFLHFFPNLQPFVQYMILTNYICIDIVKTDTFFGRERFFLSAHGHGLVPKIARRIFYVETTVHCVTRDKFRIARFKPQC